MKLLFVYPKFRRYLETNPDILNNIGGAKVHYATMTYMPGLGIPILTALTPKDEHEVHVIDQHLEDIPYDEHFDLVAITSFTPQATNAFEIGDRFRARGIKTIMGGLFAKNYPEACQEHVDSVCLGEVEAVWHEILNDASQGTLKPLYDGGNDYDMNTFVTPDRSLLKVKKGYDWRPLIQQNIRGCIFKCACCVLPNCDGQRLKYRPINSVVQEVEDNLDLDGWFIGDDQYLIPEPEAEKYAIELFSELKKLHYTKTIMLSAQPLLNKNRKLLQLIRDTGVSTLFFVLGWDPVAIRAIAYNEPQEAEETIKLLQDMGFNLFASVTVGQDVDGPDVFPRLIDFLDRNDIHHAEFMIQSPYPGSPTWRRYKKHGRILHENFELYNGAHVVFRPKKMTQEQLEDGYLYLWKEFYTRNKLTPEELMEHFHLSHEYQEKVGLK